MRADLFALFAKWSTSFGGPSPDSVNVTMAATPITPVWPSLDFRLLSATESGHMLMSPQTPSHNHTVVHQAPNVQPSRNSDAFSPAICAAESALDSAVPLEALAAQVALSFGALLRFQVC